MTRTWIAWIVALLVLPACGGPALPGFAPTFPDNDASHLDSVLSRLASAPPRSDPAVAVGVSIEPAHLYAWDLRTQSIRWSHPAEPTTEPYLAGASVITQEEGRVTARSLASGNVEFQLPDRGMRLVGADGELGLAAYVLSEGEGVAVRSRLVVVLDHVVTYEAEVAQAVGRPAVRGGLVFLPWASQNLSVFEGATGTEICRLRVSDAVVGHAVAHGHQVYFGQRGLGRITPSVAAGTRESFGWFEPAAADLPGSPTMMRDLYAPPPGPHSAAQRIELAWAPAGEGDHVGLQNDTLYLVFYKLVFALAAHDGSVRWVHEHEADVVGTRVIEGGVLVADANGDLTFLRGQDGLPTWSESTGMSPGVVQLHIGSFVPEGEAEGTAPTVREQLASAARNGDSRLVAARVYAVQRLAQLPEEQVTTMLLELCDTSELTDYVREAACEAVQTRTNGADAAIAMLERHGSFTAGVPAPPVGALAALSASLGEARAVPLLLSHLADPATAGEDLPMLFDALGRLGDNSALEPIEAFIRLYHAEEPDEVLAVALGRAARAALDLRSASESETITEVLADVLTMPEVAENMRSAMADGTEVEVAEPEQTDEPEEEPTIPVALTPAIVRGILDPIAPRLRMCLRTDRRIYRQARVMLIVLDSGEIERLYVSPSDVQPCVFNLLQEVELPQTQNRRSRVTYIIRP